MTPQQRIQAIKALASGNPKSLLQVHEEINKGSVSWQNIILCFYYLLEHGRPDGYSSSLQYKDCLISSSNDLKDIEEGFVSLAETKSYDEMSTEALTKMIECMECYRILKENGQLSILNKYKHHLDKYETQNFKGS